MQHFKLPLVSAWLGLAFFAPRHVEPTKGNETLAQRRDCQALELPKRLQSADLILDSLAFTATLSDFQPQTPGEIIISIRLGKLPMAYFMDTLAVGTFSPDLLTRVVAALRPKPPKGFPRAFRLHLQFGSAPSFKTEASVLCPPTTGEGAAVTQVRFSVESSSSSMPLPTRQSIDPSLHVDAEGKVFEVKFSPGTGNPEVDRALQVEMLRQRFEPALLDGRPVEVWLTGRRVELTG